MDNEIQTLRDTTIDTQVDIENLKLDMASFKGETYQPKYNFEELYNLKNSNDKKSISKLIKTLNIDYVDETWQKADWIAVFIAGAIGITLDVLITQTKIFRPVDTKVKEILASGKIKSFQDIMDNFSNSFRHGNSAPIDFQDFKMAGLASIHEQYSFGHDPLRFIKGIIQMITGQYSGVDRYGNLIQAPFGEGIKNPIQAVISYVAHMISDMCNQQGLPYPGSTFLMQFGSDKVRKDITTAYRAQLFNTRTFLYQSLPSLFMSMIIHSWAIYDNYTSTGKIKIKIGNNLKYQSMLLVSNAMVMTSNLSINAVRGIVTEGPRVLFRVDYPVIANTVKHSIKYLLNVNKRINMTGKEIQELYERSEREKLKNYSIDEYTNQFDKEYEEFVKEMED
ncbi:MAG: hypothetical protein MJ159_06640 [Treponemataceae bacterium]|nr:hypothetical protein [Treponemataceae bacterium]